MQPELTTPTFSLKITCKEERVLTPEIVALLIPCIMHATESGTKHDVAPLLGKGGVALIKAVKRQYNLSLYDAVHNVRGLVNTLNVADFAPPYDWTADIEAAKRVLDRLHDRGCINEWSRDDLINDVYRVCK